MRGLETFFEAVKSQLNTRLDVIVSVVHWMLVNEFDFLCVGIGEEFKPEHTNGSELLPTGWNADRNLYTLLYRSRKEGEDLKLLLKCIAVGDMFMATALPLNSSSTVHSVSIRPGDYVKPEPEWNSTFSGLFVNGSVDPLAKYLRRDMLDKIRPEVPPRQERRNEDDSILRDDRVPARPGPYPDPRAMFPGYGQFPQPLFPNYGGADLDPLGRGFGGGMIFDPFSGGRLRGPRPGMPGSYPDFGYIPPGARFDPPGPRPFRGGFRPDPDHLPPPGPPRDPDMYM